MCVVCVCVCVEPLRDNICVGGYGVCPEVNDRQPFVRCPVTTAPSGSSAEAEARSSGQPEKPHQPGTPVQMFVSYISASKHCEDEDARCLTVKPNEVLSERIPVYKGAEQALEIAAKITSQFCGCEDATQHVYSSFEGKWVPQIMSKS